jgi:hypothetical protein
MSDLDDAIREHLALKRLHGADPAEVARLEQEALGAVSRSAYEPSEERSSHLRLAEYPAAHEDEAPLREELPRREELLVPPTNEYAPAHASAYREVSHEVSEETQEYSVDDQIRWVGGPAWQGGAA